MYESTTVVVPAFAAHVAFFSASTSSSNEFKNSGAETDENSGGTKHPLRAKYIARDPEGDGEAPPSGAAAAGGGGSEDAFKRKRRLTASARKGYAAKKMRGALGAAAGLDSSSAVDGLASGALRTQTTVITFNISCESFSQVDLLPLTCLVPHYVIYRYSTRSPDHLLAI